MKNSIKFIFTLLSFIIFFNGKSVLGLSKTDEKLLNSRDIIKIASEERVIYSVNGEIKKSTSGDTIYSRPEKSDTQNAASSLDDAVDDANKFISKADIKYNKQDLKDVSNMIYNILLIVGVCIAVIMGMILGIKLMFSGIEEKADAQKLLIPYVVGCVIIFGGFGVWKVLVTALQGI